MEVEKPPMATCLPRDIPSHKVIHIQMGLDVANASHREEEIFWLSISARPEHEQGKINMTNKEQCAQRSLGYQSLS